MAAIFGGLNFKPLKELFLEFEEGRKYLLHYHGSMSLDFFSRYNHRGYEKATLRLSTCKQHPYTLFGCA